MPPALKPLYLGKCLQDLKPLFDKPFPNKNISMLCTSAPKIFDEAKTEEAKGNQEKSYILYMKYLGIVSFIQNSGDREKKNHSISKSSITHAIESAEKLSKSLQKRYHDLKLQAEKETAVKDKLKLEIVLAREETEKKGNEPNKYFQERASQKVVSPDETKNHDSISSIELYKVLQQNAKNVVIMDVRPRNQFAESHISFESCMSVPEEVLEPGCSAAVLADKLPPESKSNWNKRTEATYLVLMDWFSSTTNMNKESPLHRLKTIILEWDPLANYKSKPLILSGGFEDWLNHYPMHCTNAKPLLPNQNLDDLLDIDTVSYPDLVDETPKFSRLQKPVLKEFSDNEPGVSGEVSIDKKNNISTKGDQTNLILETKSIPVKDILSNGFESGVSSTKPGIPRIDRNSKIAAMQRYKELEDRRDKGMQCSKDLNRDREVAENELEKLRLHQGRNELTDKERDTLHQNEINLKLRIEELETSRRQKDEENECLRRELEAYKIRVQDSGSLTSYSTSNSKYEEIKSVEVEQPSLVEQTTNPNIPSSARQSDLAVPPGSSGLKRSRSSPNIAQLVKESEPKPFLPHVDRNSKPIVQKFQPQEFVNRQRNFHEVYGTGKPGLTGLKNLGNSCYMNSVLQCMSNIGVLNNYFCSGKYKEDMNRSSSNPTRGDIAEEVAHVIRNLWMGHRSIACRDFKTVVGKYMNQFQGCGQQDAHEFLTFLMDWLHNDLKIRKEEHSKEAYNPLSKKNSEIDAITGAINAWNDFRSKHESFMLTAFFVQQVSTVQCSSCRVKSMNFEEPTSNLTLLLPSAARCTLADCFRLYTSKERITGYKCESCHSLHDAEKSVDLCRLPPILIIHLKRFSSDGFYQKRQTFVDFPLENLDMKLYTPIKSQPHTVYDLCGVSNHYGTLEGGHYTAYCKNGERWYKYDDQDVSEIARDDVKSASAYILFYAAVK